MVRRRLVLLATTATALLALFFAPFVAPFAAAEDLAVPDRRSDYWHDTRSSGDDPYPSNPDWGNPDIRRTTGA